MLPKVGMSEVFLRRVIREVHKMIGAEIRAISEEDVWLTSKIAKAAPVFRVKIDEMGRTKWKR